MAYHTELLMSGELLYMVGNILQAYYMSLMKMKGNQKDRSSMLLQITIAYFWYSAIWKLHIIGCFDLPTHHATNAEENTLMHDFIYLYMYTGCLRKVDSFMYT